LTEDRARLLGDDFARLFGRTPDVGSEAYGRVNLIGEHTDYNDGFVLPTSIPQSTIAAFARRNDHGVRVWSGELSPDDVLEEFELGAESPRRSWIDYVQGVAQALARAGFRVDGFDLALRSTVPLGSGLSSSAALQVAILRGLRDLFGLVLDDVTLAKLGQRAEVDFVGAPVGIMDQMASSLAQPGVALFIDTRSLAYEQVHLPAETELAVINSGVAHNHAAGDYRTRRAECERAAEALGVKALRDVGLEALDRVMLLPDPINRRARHVITENQRVLDAVAAMRRGDAIELGRLFSASHASQRDDYAVSVPEVDLLVGLAETEPAVLGARLTGGGFGGSIVALVRLGEARGVAARVAAEYARRVDRVATVLVPQPGSDPVKTALNRV
jgi:galactokinase